MDNKIIPTVGRIVYYKARGSADGKFPKVDRAAIVTDVQDTGLENLYEVRLVVLNPEGIFFSGWLSQGQEGGQWDWMPFQKDQQLRAGYGGSNLAGGTATAPTIGK